MIFLRLIYNLLIIFIAKFIINKRFIIIRKKKFIYLKIIGFLILLY